MTGRLNGQRALVTGAAQGIGRAIALRLASEGCDVGLFDRDCDGLEETARLVRSAERRCATFVGDAAQQEEVRGSVAHLARELGHFDILVNNVGILRTSPFLDTSFRTWREVLSINLDSVFHFSQAVLPGMIERKRGCIINMSSWTGKKGVPNHSAYSTSKFAIIGLTQSIASEVAPHGIRVNAICPGIIDHTAMRSEAELLNREQGLPDLHTRVQGIPLRRAGEPGDIAGVVAFVASEDASYMTGQALNVTGGLWMT